MAENAETAKVNHTFEDASKRINNLLKNDRYNTDSLFYDDIIGMNWEDSKKLYLDDPQYIPKPPQNKFDLFFT